MKKKRYKKLTAILAAVLLLCSGIPVMAAEVNNGTTYPVSTNAIANWPQGPDTYSETAVLWMRIRERFCIIKEWMRNATRQVLPRS